MMHPLWYRAGHPFSETKWKKVRICNWKTLTHLQITVSVCMCECEWVCTWVYPTSSLLVCLLLRCSLTCCCCSWACTLNPIYLSKMQPKQSITISSLPDLQWAVIKLNQRDSYPHAGAPQLLAHISADIIDSDRFQLLVALDFLVNSAFTCTQFP